MNEPVREITREPQPIACTLEGTAVDDRVQEWRRVLSNATGRAPVDGGVALRFDLDPAIAAAVADLAAREQGCCAFFEFTLRLVTGSLWLEVRAPEDALPIVHSLFGSPDGD